MRISVIIPVYNTADYLPRCLDSILSQTCSDMEIICVDDGSTDESGDILDQYASKYKQIRVEHIENQGAMAARKIGVALATGEYIGFLDSDDWIEPDMYEIMWKIMDKHRVDMVTGGYFVDGKKPQVYFDAFDEGEYKDARMQYLRENAFFKKEIREVGIRPVMFSKIYKSEILKKILPVVPSDIKYSEDRVLTIRYLLEAKSVYVLQRAFYHYVMREESITHRKDPYYAGEMNKVYVYFRSLYSHPLFTEEMRRQAELYFVKMLIKGINTFMDFSRPYLMWYDPDWKWKLPKGSKVVLYGAGLIGDIYYQQIISDREKWLRVIGWVDKNYAAFPEAAMKIVAPDCLAQMDYDYVVITVRNSSTAEQIRSELMEVFHVEGEKICWTPHKELFWKYAEAAGLLEE